MDPYIIQTTDAECNEPPKPVSTIAADLAKENTELAAVRLEAEKNRADAERYKFVCEHFNDIACIGGKWKLLCDDKLYTGKTISEAVQAAIDAARKKP